MITAVPTTITAATTTNNDDDGYDNRQHDETIDIVCQLTHALRWSRSTPQIGATKGWRRTPAKRAGGGARF